MLPARLVFSGACLSMACISISFHISFLQRLSVSRALQRLFPISKTTFWWTSIKCIHDETASGVCRTIHYFSVNSWGIGVALSSLHDSSINGNCEVRLIKSFEAPFSFVSFTGNALKLQIYKQCTTTTT